MADHPTRRPSKDPRTAAEAMFTAKPETALPTVSQYPSVPPPRELVSLRIDRDVLEYFQAGGHGWQDRMNLALRKAASGA